MFRRRGSAAGPRARGVAALMLASSVAAACSDAPGEPTPSEASIAEESLVAEESFVAVSGEPGEVVEQECPERLAGMGLKCVLVVVQIDRADSSAGNTGVSVAIRPGTSAGGLPALAVLQGGPGGISSDLAPFLSSRPYPQVFIDQRGVGFGSADFLCHELDDVLADVIQGSPVAAPLTYRAANRCSYRLRRNPVFAHTTTAAHAADVVDVMAALGYERWLLYGVSYGTTIGLEVLRDAPASLAGAMLDGVSPANVDLDVEVAASADRAIRELDELCRSDPACTEIVSGATSSGSASLAVLLAGLIARFNVDPIVVNLAAGETTVQEDLFVFIHGNLLAVAVFEMLYDEFSAIRIPAVLAGLARHGDAGTPGADGNHAAARFVAAFAVESLARRFHSGTPATYAAVTCAERLPLASGPPVGAGEFAAAVAGEGLAAHCEPWAIAKSPAPGEPVQGDLPVLLISAWFDPITPPSFAEEVAEYLPRSTHIVSRTRGHGIWLSGYDSCVDQIVADFIAHPAAELDTTCISEDPPLRWETLN